MDNRTLAAFGLIYIVVIIAAAIFGIFVWWKIFSKAGYSGAMSLLLLVPIANLVVILILAFGEWPILRELNMLRQQNMMRPPFPPVGPQGPYQPGPQYPQQYPPNPQYPSNPQYPQY